MKEKLDGSYIYIKTFLKWLLCAIIVGIISGLIGSLFRYLIEIVTNIRLEKEWLLWFLPVGGLGIVALYRVCGIYEDSGTDLIIKSIHSSEVVPLKMAPLIFISTAITHLFGGCAGREGAALQIGGSIASCIGRVFKLDEKDIGTITMCGMSAVFATVFGTPLTATIFSLEVISVGVVYYTAIFPSLISALIGYGISCSLHLKPTAFLLKNIPQLTIKNSVGVIIIASLCALVSIFFCIMMHKAAHFMKLIIPNPYIRVVVGSGLIILLTILVGSARYNGTGANIISQAIQGYAKPEDFLLKIIFTAITLGCGFKGGEIVPTFFIGATFGSVVGGMIGIDSGFAAAIGLVALFCGVVNCPITSIILSIELFGSEGILLFSIACAVSYMLSGYYGLYSSQKIMYSKLKPKFINAHAK